MGKCRINPGCNNFIFQVENQTAICCVILKSQAQKCKIVIQVLDSKHALQNTITVS